MTNLKEMTIEEVIDLWEKCDYELIRRGYIYKDNIWEPNYDYFKTHDYVNGAYVADMSDEIAEYERQQEEDEKAYCEYLGYEANTIDELVEEMLRGKR